MSTDAELLRNYAQDGSENAFTELVRRHIDLVYSAALRESRGDAGLAEDISQAVFAELARKASRLVQHPALAGWLYTCVRQMTANVRRANDRRQRREQEVQTMNELFTSDPSDHVRRQVQPVLDDAMHELSEADRAAVVLRFFEDRSLKEVGLALGLNENAARMRVDRALEKLQSLLAKRGITTAASGLTAALAAGAVVPAPTALAAGVATGALAVTPATTSTTLTALKLMTMTKLKAGIIGAVVVTGVATSFVLQHQAKVELREENQSLQRQVNQLVQLKEENERLSSQLVQTNTAQVLAKDQLSELMRLRSEVGMLRQRTNELGKLRVIREGSPTNTSSSSEAVNSQAIPREFWAFVGYATPENALQSVAWAMSKGDAKIFLAGLSPETQRIYAQRFGGKADSEIATLLSEEISQLPALRLDRRKVSNDGAVAFVLYSEERDNGSIKTRDEAVMTFKNIGGEWKLIEREQHIGATDGSAPDATP